MLTRPRLKSLVAALLLTSSFGAWSQSAIVRGESSAGVYVNIPANSITGALFVDTSTPAVGKFSYSAGVADLAVAAAATDISWFKANTTKTVKITRITISGVQTTPGSVTVQILRRGNINTGGTATTPTFVASDPTGPASASGTLSNYTVNPGGLGSLTGLIYSQSLYVPAPAGATGSSVINYLPGRNGATPIIFRPSQANHGVAINLNGATLAGGLFNISWEWTEE